MSEATEARVKVLDSVLDDAWARGRTEGGLLNRIVGAVSGAPSAEDIARLPDDLFGAVDALGTSVALRRAVTDPGAGEQRRRQLAHAVFDGKISKVAAGIVADAAALRWAGGRAMVDALERQAVRAQLMSAEATGTLEETEDELFRFARSVDSDRELRATLGDRTASLERRQTLVRNLLTGRASEATVALAARAVAARERSFAHTIEGFVTLAAEQKNRVVATVRVARPLTPEQRERLQASLSRQAGREVALQEVIDASVLGGVRVELGDEVVEGTVAGRLASARRIFD